MRLSTSLAVLLLFSACQTPQGKRFDLGANVYAGAPVESSTGQPGGSYAYAARVYRLVVHDQGGVGIPGLHVRAWDPIDLTWRRAITDATGSAVLGGLELLRWQVAGVEIDSEVFMADLTRPFYRQGVLVLER